MSRSNILDNPMEFRRIDRSDMLSFCIDAPKHYGEAAKLGRSMHIDSLRPKKIIIAGMGGSAIGGELLKDWAIDKLTIPLDVCREYTLPAYADRDTLVFAVSYSGETEETLSIFLEAIKKKCMIITVSSGGALGEFSERLGFPHVAVPSGMAPRATLPYLFMPLPFILERLDFVSDVNEESEETIKILKGISMENSLDRATESNFSKTLASQIKGSVPVIYGFGRFRSVAQRFKTQFNENSKNPSKWDYFSELNHNEIVGWEKPKSFAKCFSSIFIRDKSEKPEIHERIEFTENMMCSKGIPTYEISSRGNYGLAKMASVICIGDFVSVYLAVLRGIDPTPVDSINRLKDQLAQTGFKKRVVKNLRQVSK